MPAAVQPEKILRDLRELWAQLGREQQTAGGVLRACAMTLVAIAEDEADAERVRQTLGILMHDHPSRAIVLRASAGAALDARVFAECWMPYGRRQQICAEGIELTADAAQWNEVAQFLLPLIVADLPVVLWCRGPRAFTAAGLDPLYRLAGKTIFDSSAAPDPEAAIAALKKMRARGQNVADLAWTRLTGWREVLAHVFDDSRLSVDSLRSAHIAYGQPAAGGVPTGAQYFATWIGQAVPSATVTLDPAPGDPGVRGVTLSGAGGDIHITRADEWSVKIRAGARLCRSLLPSATEDALMREELAVVGVDSIFDKLLS